MPQTIQFVIPGLLCRHAFSLLSGAPYTGKSRFALWLSTRLASGQPGFWGQLDPIRILFCSERSIAVTNHQLEALGLPLETPNLKFFCVTDFKGRELAEFRQMRFHAIDSVVKDFKPDIVILDTLIHFLPPSNTNDYKSMMDSMMTINCWANEYGVAVLGIHHTAKEKNDSFYASPLQKSLGSQAIVGGTLSTWLLTPASDVEDEKAEDRYIKLRVYSHIAKPSPPYYFHCDSDGLINETTAEEAGALHVVDAPGPAQQRLIDLIPVEGIEKENLIQLATVVFSCSTQNIYKLLSKLYAKGWANEEENATQKTVRKAPKFILHKV